MQDELEDIVAHHLMAYAAALKPPESDAHIRHAPDPSLIADVAINVVIPFLVSVASALSTELLLRGRRSDEARDLARRAELVSTPGEQADTEDDDLDALAIATGVLAREELSEAELAKLGDEVASQVAGTLRRYHLSARTADPLARLLTTDLTARLIRHG